MPVEATVADGEETSRLAGARNSTAANAFSRARAPMPIACPALMARRRACTVVGLDWDNVSATDILAIMRSFCPSHGTVLKVRVPRSPSATAWLPGASASLPDGTRDTTLNRKQNKAPLDAFGSR